MASCTVRPRSSGTIVVIASFAVIDVEQGGGFCVGQRPVQQVDALVLFCLQRVPQHVGHAADAQGANGVDEQGVAAIEGVDVAETILEAGPARGLHRTTYLQRELVKVQLPLVGGNASFEHQTAQVAVGGDVVEAVIVHAGVGQMLRHVGDDVPLGHGEQILISGQLEAEQGIAVLESLGPLGPAARRVAAGDGDDGGAIAGLPTPVEAQCFFRGQLVARARQPGNRSFAFKV